MSDIHTFALQQPDQARTDFAAIESELEVNSEAACATADTPGASRDRARHHLRDHDAERRCCSFFLWEWVP
jgi:hypothetical protein